MVRQRSTIIDVNVNLFYIDNTYTLILFIIQLNNKIVNNLK